MGSTAAGRQAASRGGLVPRPVQRCPVWPAAGGLLGGDQVDQHAVGVPGGHGDRAVPERGHGQRPTGWG